MKKNIFVLTSLMLTLGCGCDSFLDETNYSDVTSEGGYYDTEAGLNAVVNACYTPLRFWAGKEDAIGLSETGTDIIAAGSGCVDNNMAAYTQSLDGTNSASRQQMFILPAVIHVAVKSDISGKNDRCFLFFHGTTSYLASR